MSSRSNEKRFTRASRTLKLLREQSRLSIRGAAKASGVGDGVINHLEHGRIRVHRRHLEKLLPAYGATLQTYEMFESGAVDFPHNIRSECIDLIRVMSSEKLKTVHPVLLSLAAQR